MLLKMPQARLLPTREQRGKFLDDKVRLSLERYMEYPSNNTRWRVIATICYAMVVGLKYSFHNITTHINRKNMIYS